MALGGKEPNGRRRKANVGRHSSGGLVGRTEATSQTRHLGLATLLLQRVIQSEYQYRFSYTNMVYVYVYNHGLKQEKVLVLT